MKVTFGPGDTVTITMSGDDLMPLRYGLDAGYWKLRDTAAYMKAMKSPGAANAIETAERICRVNDALEAAAQVAARE